MSSCFVSYTQTDRAWAEWIAAVLRDGGHDVTMQMVDFRPGENFVLRMQSAAAQADHTVVVLSARYLASPFASTEWAAAFATDPTGASRRLIPVAVERVAANGLWAPIIRIELAGRSEAEARELLLEAFAPQVVPAVTPAFPATAAPAAAAAVEPSTRRQGQPAAVQVWRLPVAPGPLVGRDDELALLDTAWASGRTTVLTIVAWGGAGKTALLNHWLARMATDGYRGADRVYAWSFYRQSDSGPVDTSDQFLDAVLTWLDVRAAATLSVWERCRLLATALQESRTLLILDGIESLQHPPGPDAGALRDPALRILIRELAAFNPGLCVITSRLPVVDIAPFAGQTCTELPLRSLTREAGAALLRRSGVVGDDDRLRALSDQVEGHALTLTLLGGYIRTVFDGDASRWDTSRLSRAARRGGTPATRVMQAYDRWFGGRPEGQILSLVGLFDRPAGPAQLGALRAGPVVDGLNDLLTDLDHEEWSYAVENLRNAGLLMAATDNVGALDAHPLVRQHYRERHVQELPDAHVEGHRRLFEHLRASAAELPRTLTETLPLIAAVWHGTQAGLADVALREVYWPRIAQDCHHLRDVLGAASSNHEVLVHLLAGYRSQRAVDGLELALLLCDQALDLRMMGRAADAVRPFERAIELAAAGGDAGVAANAGRHLSQLYLALGRLDDALTAAGRARDTARGLPASNLEQLACAATLGDVHHQRGEFALAREMFLAGGLSSDTVTDRGRHHAHRVTFYIGIYRYCDLLLTLHDVAGREPVAGLGLTGGELVAEVLAVAGRGRDLNAADRDIALATALMALAGERARVAAALADPTAGDLDPTALDTTVDELRRIGQRPWLVHSLLARAGLLRAVGRLDAAVADLEQARSVAATDGTLLQGLDCELEAVQVELATGNAWQAGLLTESLDAKVRRVGYGRLLSRLASIRTRLG